MDEYGSLGLLSDVYGEGYYIWTAPGTGMHGNPDSEGDYVRMQTDGNLVVYREGDNGDVKIWASNTAGNPGAELKLEKQGAAVIESKEDRIIWTAYERGCKWTDPSEENQFLMGGEKLYPGQYICRNFYRFGMDENGHLGIFFREDSDLEGDDDAYDNDYEDDWDNHDLIMWRADYDGEAFFVQMKKNGNLVVYKQSKESVWKSHTRNNVGASLAIAQGGEVSIIEDIVAGGAVLWSVGPFDG